MKNYFLNCSLLFTLVLGNAHGADNNYPPEGPFFTGFFAGESPRDSNRPLKFVSYNIAIGENVKGVIADLTSIPEVKDADFILLQEVSGKVGGGRNDAEEIAQALKMNYVFAPGTVLWEKDYGNAVLSRWPFKDARKALLRNSDPDNQRVAVGITALVGKKLIQVYSIHLRVKFSDSFGGERSRAEHTKASLEQIEMVGIQSAFISGDFNNFNPMGWNKVKDLFQEHQFQQVPDSGWTFRKRQLTLDHAFIRAGKVVQYGVSQSASGSDHVPIWSLVEY